MSSEEQAKKPEEEQQKNNLKAQSELIQALYGFSIKDSSKVMVKGHKFWDTQPTNNYEEEVEKKKEKKGNPEEEEESQKPKKLVNEAVEDTSKKVIRQKPLKLIKGFQWYNLNLTNAKELNELYELLRNNYVEDSASTFRFNYTKPFLQWALLTPNYNPQYHISIRQVRLSEEGKKKESSLGPLLAFISGIPVTMKIHNQIINMIEINFLCIHKKLRSKRLAPVLIKEITRRANVNGIYQAVYTAGIYLPKPIATTRYFHRSLRPKKLIEIGLVV